jgi:TPR repeat protein
MKLLTLLCLPFFLSLGLCQSALATTASAMRAIERGHYATAARALRKPAQAGDALAQNNLAYLYEYGLGLTQSDSEALLWYTRAAVGGLPGAQYNLATFYLKGRGVTQSDATALKWLEAAANGGYTDAEFMLGEFYRRGRVLKKDSALALSWYMKAARKGQPTAQLMAASVYLSGEAWRSEPEKAWIWAELARQNGEVQAVGLVSRATQMLSREALEEAQQTLLMCQKSELRDCPE